MAYLLKFVLINFVFLLITPLQDNQYPEDKHKIRGYNEVVEKPQKYNKNSMNNGE